MTSTASASELPGIHGFLAGFHRRQASRTVDFPAESWRRIAPDVAEEHLHDLVERRAARRHGAEVVRFLAAYSADGEVAAWADLYLDPATGVAQIEDLVTAGAHLGKGHAGAVLDTALSIAADAGCTTRFLTARPDDWPHRWYGRKGFEVVGSVSRFERS
ncbi:GNAT family N-acetyltransferase [Streptomyces sp. NPDC059352]|uniref:GNAT family N-acetyltransferase n=1 Tax=Streptomyces sp. NPDC059352 TaxID=3346810 RepID=UPI0036B15731